MTFRQVTVVLVSLLAFSRVHAVPDDVFEKLAAEARPAKDNARDGELNRITIDHARVLIQQNSFIILSESSMLHSNGDYHPLSIGPSCARAQHRSVLFEVTGPL